MHHKVYQMSPTRTLKLFCNFQQCKNDESVCNHDIVVDYNIILYIIH